MRILNPDNPLGRSFIAGTRFIGRIVTVNRPMNRTLATAFSRNGLSGLKLLWAVAALMLCTTVSAVGIGGINVASALGQPLKADIDLLAVSKAEKSSLVARLASPDAYESAGLEYPFRNKFKFQIESRADGEPYLTVSSAQPINDPFVTMLVELTWADGKLLREYTFLLDPIGYVPAQPAQAAVRVVAPAVQVAASEVPAASAEIAPASEAPAAPAEATAKPAVVEPMTGSVTTGSIAIPANKEWLVVKRVNKRPPSVQTGSKKQVRSPSFRLEISGEPIYESRIGKISEEERTSLLARQKLLGADDQMSSVLTLQHQVQQLQAELGELKLQLAQLGASPSNAPSSTPPASTATVATDTQEDRPKPAIPVKPPVVQADNPDLQNELFAALGLTLAILALWQGLRYYNKIKSHQGDEHVMKSEDDAVAAQKMVLPRIAKPHFRAQSAYSTTILPLIPR